MDDPLFRNGGELGRAMAERDWGATTVGPPDSWPAGLRNMVRIVLTSRFSMWAAWGPDLTFFYNDAYWRDTLQAKHPWALGRPAAEVWAEIWQDIGPRIRSVLDTGLATWDEDLLLFLERSGYREETYHTFSYSPLDGDDGRVEGMLCVVAETTERVLAERRMGTLRDLGTAVAGARTEQDVLAAVRRELDRNLADLPFSLVYLVDERGGARLGAAAGIAPGDPAAPLGIDDADPRPAWPLDRLRAGEQVLVEDLAERFPQLPTGAWAQPPRRAVALPLTSSAQELGPVAGFLVVGLNPHRAYDEAYRGFVGLVASQIASGLVNAGSYEAERRRAEALAELDRAKTDFFSNVSHEFRTPLTLITGPLRELLESPAVAADARARAELEVIERNAQRLGRLVNTLLDFSRLQAGRIEARFEPVDLAAATTELASVFRSAVERAGLDFTVDCPPLGTPVHVDRDMWEKVVLNLLSNAVKFTFEGGITVRLRRSGDRAVLTVADTGTGVPAEELPRLFERFHRVRRARSRSGEGSGIGLAMVRELVGLHGGAITAESEAGLGTTFTVTLPLGSAHLPADQVAQEAAGTAVSAAAVPFVTEAMRWLPGAGEAGPAQLPVADTADADPLARAPGRVLVADDNADMREYLQRLLAGRYAVEVVSDGQAALDAALAAPPDLVVSDVMMPRLDGLGLLAALRADERTARVPVLLLSARAGQEAAVEGLAAGADDYLVKPFSARELMARVGAHLELGRVRRDAEERFRAMADLAPALIWVADAAGRRVFLNAAWREFTGAAGDEDLADRWQQRLHPEDRDRYVETVGAAVADHRPWEIEYRLQRADGAYHWLIERAVPLGGRAGFVGSCTDINARYRESQRQTLLAEVGAALDRAGDMEAQLGALARLVVTSRLSDACDVRRVDDDGRLHRVTQAALDPATEDALASYPAETPMTRQAVDTGRTVTRPARSDVPVIPSRDAGPAELRRRLEANSAMVVPLVVRGRVLAVLGLGRRPEAPGFNADDRELAEEIAGRAALAIDNALLLAEERATAQRLSLLQRATAALSAATTPTSVAVTAADHVRQLLGPDSVVAVYEVDQPQRVLTALVQDADGSGHGERWRSIPLSTVRPLTLAVHERSPQWFEDFAAWSAQHPDRHPDLDENMARTGSAGGVALPLAVGGTSIGALGVGFPSARRLTATERATLLALAEQCAQALDRARLYRAQQRIAETLQRNLLPQGLPGLDRLALAARYLPGAEGTQAGGDWYDVVQLDDDCVAFAVGDVVGQGPAAAAVMGQLRSALSSTLLTGAGPAEALELLDRFASRLPGATASSALCLVVDAARGTIRWARAGHPPPLVVSGGRARYLDSAGAGTVLGVPGRPPYSEGTARIEAGAVLLLYTDGLVERRDETLDAGLDRLAAAAVRHAAEPPQRLATLLLDEILADTDQPDDVALVAARLVPAPLEDRLPADPARLARVRRAVQAWADEAGLPEETTEDLQLALGEAVANAVEHAYRGTTPGECAYRLAWTADGAVAVDVEDFGAWRAIPEDPGFRGRGLLLIRRLAEGVVVEPTPGGGTTVRFRVRPRAAGAGPVVPALRAAGAAVDDLRVTVTADGGTVALAGELDLATSATAASRLLAAADRPGGELVLDLREVTYLASAGVGLVLEADRRVRAAGGRLRVLVRGGSAPARTLSLAGLDDLAAAADDDVPAAR
ncbi:SpoIIE family protein phosphatase [Geodermatophilus sp. SYSU D00815]